MPRPSIVPRRPLLALLIALVVAAAACSDGDEPAENTRTEPTAADGTAVEEQQFPDVVAVEVERAGDGTARFDVTISSPYDTPERYADAWRIVGPDGTEYGVRELTHDHANEQPFTRSLDGVVLPADVETVTIEARDSKYGWGGTALDAEL